MIKIFVDSGSSIKESEKEKYGVEILPLKLTIDGKEYDDGVNLPIDTFYKAIMEKKLFPKTSLPSLKEAEMRVKSYTDRGDEVIILTISSGISGTYGAISMLFSDNERVRVIDTKTAVGGIRILVLEALKHLDKPLDFVCEQIYKLIPRIKVVAIPETLEYLHRGGRLSRAAWLFGSVLQLKPLISLGGKEGKVAVLGKARGIRRAMEELIGYLEKLGCDTDYPIVPSYTYDTKNLDTLVSITDEKYKARFTEYDNLDPAIACHWGPFAFGYIFVGDSINKR